MPKFTPKKSFTGSVAMEMSKSFAEFFEIVIICDMFVFTVTGVGWTADNLLSRMSSIYDSLRVKAGTT